MADIMEVSMRLVEIARAEGGAAWHGKPERWWDDPHWRCSNNHVSTTYLKSEALGRAACLASGCREPLTLTFPEDKDGPLVIPWWVNQ